LLSSSIGANNAGGLLTADVPRKNVEAIALRLLGAGLHAERQVRALQQFIGEVSWDDEALLAEHQRLVEETLGENDGVLNTLGSNSPKHGRHPVGVAPQWCGNTGKKDNCQAGSSWGMPAAREPPCLTSGCICLSPGLARITRGFGMPARFPKAPPSDQA